MLKNVIISGLLGGVVLLLVTFILNGILGFKSSLEMNVPPNEKQIYGELKKNIDKPGRYICNPPLTANGVYPEGEPVYSILYGGVGHEAAGSQMIVGLLIFFIAPIIGSWLLSQTSQKVLLSYPRKVFFFSSIGFLFALFNNLNNYGIGNYPFSDALILAIYNIFVWSVVGLVVARKMKPIGKPEAVQ